MKNRNVSKCVDNGRQILLSKVELLNHNGQSGNYTLNGFIIIFKEKFWPWPDWEKDGKWERK